MQATTTRYWRKWYTIVIAALLAEILLFGWLTYSFA